MCVGEEGSQELRAASSWWFPPGGGRVPLTSEPVDTASASPRKRHALQLFEGLPRRYDQVGAVMSFGQDPRWRRAMVDAVDPRPGQRILDVATGTGMVARGLAQRGAEVTALDQSEAMLAIARRRPHPGITFVTGEAERLPFADAGFDGLTFTYLLRYVDDPAATMRELARVLKPGGRIGMVEFGVPDNGVLRALWRAHTRAGLPLIGRRCRPAGMRWPLPGPQHRAVSRHRARPAGAVARRRAARRAIAADELRRGPGHVGVADGHHP